VVDQAVHHVDQNSHPLGDGRFTTRTACATFVDMSNPWPTSDGSFGHQLVLVQLVDIRWESVGELRQAVGLQCHGEWSTGDLRLVAMHCIFVSPGTFHSLCIAIARALAFCHPLTAVKRNAHRPLAHRAFTRGGSGGGKVRYDFGADGATAAFTAALLSEDFGLIIEVPEGGAPMTSDALRA
jgi:hypothetical protein